MKDTLVPGLAHQTRHVVTTEMSAAHLPRVVLSTPTMVSLIEGTCLAAAAPHLEAGETTVGTHICVSHDSAVGEGQAFVIRASLGSIEGRRLNFDVEVDGPGGRVSRGTHQRAVVNLARMAGGA
jgi:fluoroacetyl-CoA thioesterase